MLIFPFPSSNVVNISLHVHLLYTNLVIPSRTVKPSNDPTFLPILFTWLSSALAPVHPSLRSVYVTAQTTARISVHLG